jgi:hypothetical protein
MRNPQDILIPVHRLACSAYGTDRRLRNVCVDGGNLGQTGPDMLNAPQPPFSADETAAMIPRRPESDSWRA